MRAISCLLQIFFFGRFLSGLVVWLFLRKNSFLFSRYFYRHLCVYKIMADEMMSVTDVYHALKNKPFTSENDGERDEFTVEPPTSGTTYDDDDDKNAFE